LSELALTKATAQWLAYTMPRWVAWSHFPAGEVRTQRTGAKLKSMGTKRGWPDFVIVHNGKAFFIELKTAKGRLSDNQKAAHADLMAAGADVSICRSIEDVIATCRARGLI